jgi:hypothetical protein
MRRYAWWRWRQRVERRHRLLSVAVRRVNDYQKLKGKYLRLRARWARRGKYHLADIGSVLRIKIKTTVDYWDV